MEAEDPVRFSSTDILPYPSHPSRSCSSVSEFDTQSEAESSSSFFDFNDSHRMTLRSIIGLPMESFRHFGESFRSASRSTREATAELPKPDHRLARRPRTCSFLFDLLGCLQRTLYDYVPFKMPVARANLNNLALFTITVQVSEEEEGDSEASEVGPTVFENSVLVERDISLGSCIYEFNPLYISDAISKVDPEEVRDVSLPRDQRRRCFYTRGFRQCDDECCFQRFG